MQSQIDTYDSSERFFDVADALFDLYISFKGRYVMSYNGRMFVPKTKDGEDLRLDNKAICNHLNHKSTVSVYAGRVCSKFICFDVDDGSKETVKKLIDAISYAGFDQNKIYVSTSGGKGFHVEMFFDELMRTSVLRAFYNYICEDAKVDKTLVEFRPTFSQAIKLPLGKHYLTKNVCWYLDTATLEPIKDPRYILEIKKYNSDDSYKLIRFLVGDAELFGGSHLYAKKKDDTPSQTFEFSGSGKYGYPDLAAKHTTHNTILAIAKHESCKGLSECEIDKRLNEWLSEQNEEYLTDPIPKIRKDIADVAKYVHSSSFVVKHKQKLIFTPDEIKLLIEKRPKVQRKILFLIMLCQKKYGFMRLGADHIAEKIGFSRQGVIKAVEELKRDSIIDVENQTPVRIGECFLARPNVYTIIGKPKEPDKIWILTDELTLEDAPLQEMWLKLIHMTLRKEDWKKYFTKKEMEELNNHNG